MCAVDQHSERSIADWLGLVEEESQRKEVRKKQRERIGCAAFERASSVRTSSGLVFEPLLYELSGSSSAGARNRVAVWCGVSPIERRLPETLVRRDSTLSCAASARLVLANSETTRANAGSNALLAHRASDSSLRASGINRAQAFAQIFINRVQMEVEVHHHLNRSGSNTAASCSSASKLFASETLNVCVCAIN